jgi:hypothetical protein
MYWQKLEVGNVTYLWVETGNLKEIEKIKKKVQSERYANKTFV